MKKIDLDELRQLQIQILDEVSSFCESNNIKYFLMAGTLIGAVRHQGYIPWDDDIDIGMLREDYDKFIKLYSSQKNTQYYLHGYEIDKKSSFPFIKCCLKNTLVTEKGLIDKEIFGVNIDIFPIDTVLSSDIQYVIKTIDRVKLKRHWKVIDEEYLQQLSPYKGFRYFRKYLLLKYLKIIPMSFIFEKIYSVIENQKFLDSSNIKKGNIVWGYGECELVNPEIFENTITILFEGKMYRVPEKYDEWLTSVYGDYMQLPPIEKRVSHHHFNAFYTNHE
ncbi:LicD family protein [Moraxella oblonga]|uniref:LicD family protein n=1 Tax=Moraxella oblonga TaxID=200413 RepID=UPI00082EE94B|nr:LicD family protein [Moraxella oblonga]